MPPSYSPVEDRLNELHVDLGALADAESAAGNGTHTALLKRLRTLLNDIGAAADAESGSGNGTVIAILKRVRTLFSAGMLGGSPIIGAAVSAAAPVAGTVVGDTGVLAAGTYRVRAVASGAGAQAAGVHLEFQHRDATNAANVSNGPVAPLGQNVDFEIQRVTVLANERFRFITVGTPVAGSIYGSRIVATPTTP